MYSFMTKKYALFHEYLVFCIIYETIRSLLFHTFKTTRKKNARNCGRFECAIKCTLTSLRSPSVVRE